MPQLTEERFEEILTEKLAPLATKADVHREVRDGVDELARLVSAGFEDIQKQLDVRDRVERHEVLLKELARQAGLKLDW
ncbi:MAG TPA: hypothetical protein VJ728_18100 [Candidatus Binataceae bacterium]|nr:hypothetical protein [Candidatus Binataceae bacterium]